MKLFEQSIDSETYKSIYDYLVDEKKVFNSQYKSGSTRIKPSFFVDAIFEDYYQGETVHYVDSLYVQKSTGGDLTKNNGKNISWIKHRFKLIQSTSTNSKNKELTKNLSSKFTENEFKNFLIIYLTKMINKNEQFKGSKILEQWVLDDWEIYLNSINYDKKLLEIGNEKNLHFQNNYINITNEEQQAIKEILEDHNIKPTSKKILIDSRIGQGKYREDLLSLRERTCMISEIKAPELLIASHIVPWIKSNNIERLDPNNGLLLSASIDKLFDKYHISFNENGYMVISKKFKKNHSNYKQIMSIIGIYKSMIDQEKSLELNPETKEYMNRHFKEFKIRE